MADTAAARAGLLVDKPVIYAFTGNEL
ncbi:uncharacterized protein METZ01_LOCUS158712 [marine metagenome]|uniref:Uncharacterized protein n=1 Tax=marine metagenome TaxID=408172 RepID=A0A382AWN7_9ZZZZ